MAKAAPAKAAASNAITAYNMKTKEKNVPIQEPVIALKGGKYIAKGHDGNGNTLTTIMNKEKAENAVKEGIAKAGEGFPKAGKGK